MVNTKLTYKSGRGLAISLPSDPKIWLVLLAFCEKNIIRYVVLVMSMIPVLSYISGFVVPFLYITLILACVFKARTIGFSELGVIAFTVLAIVGTCMLYPDNAEYIFDSNNFWNTIFPCLRFFIVALAFTPSKANMTLLGKVSCISIFVECLFVIAYMMPNGLLESDDMSRAYQLLPNILVVINYTFNEKKLLAWLSSVMGVIYLLALGTRGPIVIMLAFVFLKFMKANFTKMWEKVFFGASLVVIGMLFMNSYICIAVLEFLKQTLSEFGLSTRIIDFAIKGTMISYTSGRNEIFDLALQMIGERFFLGYGVYGEWRTIGWSVHNIYLEFFLHYGVVLGSVLLLWIINLVRKAYFSSHNTYSQDIILIFVCLVFIRGIFGGSYLMFGMYFLIGFCIKEIRRTKQQNLVNKGWSSVN